MTVQPTTKKLFYSEASDIAIFKRKDKNQKIWQAAKHYEQTEIELGSGLISLAKQTLQQCAVLATKRFYGS